MEVVSNVYDTDLLLKLIKGERHMSEPAGDLNP